MAETDPMNINERRKYLHKVISHKLSISDGCQGAIYQARLIAWGLLRRKERSSQ
jgi:hypothetical protein